MCNRKSALSLRATIVASLGQVCGFIVLIFYNLAIKAGKCQCIKFSFFKIINGVSELNIYGAILTIHSLEEGRV